MTYTNYKFCPELTKEELLVVKYALLEFTMLREDGMDAVEFPVHREIATTLLRKLDEAYIMEDI